MLEQDVSSVQMRDDLGFFRACDLEATGRLIHAFSTRLGGVSPPPFQWLNLSDSTGDQASRVRENRNILAGVFGISPSTLVTANQIHQDGVLVIDASSPPNPPKASCDAIVTQRPGIAIGVLTADCVPVLLYDSERSVIAAIHVGWKGTALNLCAKTIRLMAERFGTDPKSLLGAVGPSIGPCCYEVDHHVCSSFSEHSGRWTAWARPSAPGRWKLDLPRANIEMMTSVGVPGENITCFRTCTCCQEDLFFSHRRDNGITGRQISFVMMK
jgi:YfiH family protein